MFDHLKKFPPNFTNILFRNSIILKVNFRLNKYRKVFKLSTLKVIEDFFRKNNGWKVFDSNAIHRENKAVTVVNRGVKESMPNIIMHGENKDRLLFDHRCNGNNTEIWMIVEDGIKNTYPDMIPGDYNWQKEFDADKVIEYGVKV